MEAGCPASTRISLPAGCLRFGYRAGCFRFLRPRPKPATLTRLRLANIQRILAPIATGPVRGASFIHKIAVAIALSHLRVALGGHAALCRDFARRQGQCRDNQHSPIRHAPFPHSAGWRAQIYSKPRTTQLDLGPIDPPTPPSDDMH